MSTTNSQFQQNSMHQRAHLLVHVFFFISILLGWGLLPVSAQERGQTGCPDVSQGAEQPVAYKLTPRRLAITSCA